MTPFKGRNRVTSPRGYREYWYRGTLIKEDHKGQDIVGDDSQDVRAIWDAFKVEVSLGYNYGRGNMVTLYYNDRLRVICQHLASVYVKHGQSVKQGQAIGLMGSTGQSTGAHLHIEPQKKQGSTWVPVSVGEISGYTEVPNKVGTYQGNDNIDGKKPAEPSTVTLYKLEIGPMSAGDVTTIRNMASSLSLPVTAKQAGTMATLTVGPMTQGDKVTVENVAKGLRLPVKTV